MSVTKRTAFMAFGWLKEMDEKHKGAEQQRPGRVALADLIIEPALLQPREGGSPTQVLDLRRVLRRDREDLDPILVRQIGPKFLVIDGHHRFSAYRAEGGTTIPCTHFEGSIADAFIEALKRNGKTQEPLTRDDRRTAAWRAVCMGKDEFSIAQIATASDTGTTTVSRMREVFERLGAGKARTCQTWAEAMRADKGKTFSEMTPEQLREELEDQVRRKMERLKKEFQGSLRKNPETTGKALNRHLGHTSPEAAEAMLNDMGEEAVATIFDSFFPEEQHIIGAAAE
jgi:ParB-like nuclease domain